MTAATAAPSRDAINLERLEAWLTARIDGALPCIARIQLCQWTGDCG